MNILLKKYWSLYPDDAPTALISMSVVKRRSQALLSLKSRIYSLGVLPISLENSGYRTFKNSIKYIHANYTEKIEIPHLAKLEGLSNSRYIVVFSKEMGKTPREYILDLRLARACDLLLSTDMEINQVGASSGYKDQYFFSKIFKKHMGISPQEYRKTHK